MAAPLVHMATCGDENGFCSHAFSALTTLFSSGSHDWEVDHICGFMLLVIFMRSSTPNFVARWMRGFHYDDWYQVLVPAWNGLPSLPMFVKFTKGYQHLVYYRFNRGEDYVATQIIMQELAGKYFDRLNRPRYAALLPSTLPVAIEHFVRYVSRSSQLPVVIATIIQEYLQEVTYAFNTIHNVLECISAFEAFYSHRINQWPLMLPFSNNVETTLKRKSH